MGTKSGTNPARASEAQAAASMPRNAKSAAQAQRPEVVISGGQRMVRTPAGGLIPETQWQAMTHPPREPARPPVPTVSPARRRSQNLMESIEALIEAEPNGVTRRRKMDPIIFRHVAVEMEAGAGRPDPVPHIGALTPVGVAVAVELGAEWIGRGKALGWTPKEGENRAVSAVAEWVGKFHPEQAAKVAAQPGLVRNAVRAWARGSGRPTKGEYRGSKWDAVAELCKVAGIRDHEPETIKKAWQRSEHK